MQQCKKTTLVFPNIQLLWAFAQSRSKGYMEISTKTNTITLDCSEMEVQRAITHFRAVVYEEVENSRQYSK